MLAGTGLTVCPACESLVPAISGICVICGCEFCKATMEKEVGKCIELLEAA